MTRRQRAAAVLVVVCIVVAVAALSAAVLVWQQPGEVKGLTITIVAVCGALIAWAATAA